MTSRQQPFAGSATEPQRRASDLPDVRRDVCECPAWLRLQTLVCYPARSQAQGLRKALAFLDCKSYCGNVNSAKLWVVDKVEYTEQERWLIEPKPGTAAAAARDFGIDLSITVGNLRLTPHQRVKRLDEFQHELRQLRQAVKLSERYGGDRPGSEAVR